MNLNLLLLLQKIVPNRICIGELLFGMTPLNDWSLTIFLRLRKNWLLTLASVILESWAIMTIIWFLCLDCGNGLHWRFWRINFRSLWTFTVVILNQAILWFQNFIRWSYALFGISILEAVTALDTMFLWCSGSLKFLAVEHVYYSSKAFSIFLLCLAASVVSLTFLFAFRFFFNFWAFLLQIDWAFVTDATGKRLFGDFLDESKLVDKDQVY